MIVVKLIGGLGNQLFQYAAGRALAARHGVELRLDLSGLEEDSGLRYTQRHYELDAFDLAVTRAEKTDLGPFEDRRGNRLLRVLQRETPFLFSKAYIAESGSSYHRQFKNYPANTYLDGFWQSERYFSEQEPLIRRELQFRQSVKDAAAEWLPRLNSSNSVSLHVRRGDYVTSQAANQHHGTLSQDYYTKAVRHVTQVQPDIEIFVFSDDVSWCRKHLRFEVPVHFVEPGPAATAMYLMSRCRHHIIANSSFSWWGAWLDGRNDKIVTVPPYWFTTKKTSDLDIAAQGWTIL